MDLDALGDCSGASDIPCAGRILTNDQMRRLDDSFIDDNSAHENQTDEVGVRDP